LTFSPEKFFIFTFGHFFKVNSCRIHVFEQNFAKIFIILEEFLSKKLDFLNKTLIKYEFLYFLWLVYQKGIYISLVKKELKHA